MVEHKVTLRSSLWFLPYINMNQQHNIVKQLSSNKKQFLSKFESRKKKRSMRTSLVIQWLRLHLLMQGVQVPSLVRELRYHILLLLLLSLQSCPTLCDPIDGSPPGSPVRGFSKQEHWSRLPFPSPIHEREKGK